MAPALSTTSYALLGLLSLQDWTTYELAKQVRRSLHWFWPRAERKLYDEPKRLVAAGLVTASRQHTGRRARTVYSITGSGRGELHRWLGCPPAPPVTEFEGMLKVFFATAGDREDLLRTLQVVADQAAERRAVLTEMAQESLAGVSPFPDRRHIGALTLRLQVDQEQLLEQWAVWAQAQVAGWRTTRDPGGWSAEAVLAALVGSEAAAARRSPSPAGGG
jgi:PadR family transcriptional regulator, regulatory protein AphA